MRRRICILLLGLWTAAAAICQEQKVVRTGLLSAQLTLSPAYMFAGSGSCFYLHGGLEGFISDRISLAGDGFYYLGSSAEKSGIAFNHNVFFGASRHFVSNSHDLFIGLQPGLAFIRLDQDTYGLAGTRTGIDPVISPVAGYSFYLDRFFHFFVQARLVAGWHNTDAHRSLGELRISAGLGFNLNTMK